jgi:hypothetical protein
MMIFVFFDYLKRNKKKRLFPLAVVTPLSGCLVFCFFIIIIIGLLLLLFRKNALIAYCFFVFFFLFGGGGAGEFVFRVVRALLFVTRMTMSK